MIANSHPVLENHVLDQMKNLGYVQQSYIQQQFANYIYIVQTLHDLDSKVLGLNPNNPSPFDVGIPLSSSQIPLNYLNYSQAAYFAANGLSTLGTELVLNNSAIDPIFPLMRHPTILHLYMGFITDGILYSYPGHEITNPAYTPIVREWFYTAQDAPGSVIITEPYVDASTGNWVITVSEALLNTSGTVIGVVAADITLVVLTERLANITIVDTGFVSLVSAQGILLNMPIQWKLSSTLRIYDTINTGISSIMWTTMQNSPDGTRFDFTDGNGTDYFMVIFKIAPFANLPNVTHYLLVVSNKTDLNTPINHLESSYLTVYTVIFWFVLAVAIVVLIVTISLLWIETKKLAAQLKNVEKTFAKIIRRALFPKITKGVGLIKMHENRKGIEILIDSCKEYIARIKEKEEDHAGFQWGLTRPEDFSLYSSWEEEIYPFNLYNDNPIKWIQAFPYLENSIPTE